MIWLLLWLGVGVFFLMRAPRHNWEIVSAHPMVGVIILVFGPILWPGLTALRVLDWWRLKKYLG